MATYKDIQDRVRKTHGWVPKTCWIAHCKELKRLPVGQAHNRQDSRRKVPCPVGKRAAIFEAFHYFRMI